MKHTSTHYTIKNVVLLSATNAAKPCNKSGDNKLYKIWVAAKKDILREVLEDAWRPNEINNQDVFDFCEVQPCNNKIQRALRLCEYENPEDYLTFEIISWNKPITCDQVNNFDELLMQEFTVTLDTSWGKTAIRDADGHVQYDTDGKCKQKDCGHFCASQTFIISDLDLGDDNNIETFDE